jgi:hypothetical protein
MRVSYWRVEGGRKVLREAEVDREIESFQGKVLLCHDENGLDIAIPERSVYSPKQLSLFGDDQQD